MSLLPLRRRKKGMKLFLSLIGAETLMGYYNIGILITKQSMIEPDDCIFLNAGDLIRHGGAVSINIFMSFFIAVEKYLPDNAAFSAYSRTLTSYFAENKGITAVNFSWDL
jgi:hypothetical protein